MRLKQGSYLVAEIWLLFRIREDRGPHPERRDNHATRNGCREPSTTRTAFGIT